MTVFCSFNTFGISLLSNGTWVSLPRSNNIFFHSLLPKVTKCRLVWSFLSLLELIYNKIHFLIHRFFFPLLPSGCWRMLRMKFISECGIRNFWLLSSSVLDRPWTMSFLRKKNSSEFWKILPQKWKLPVIQKERFVKKYFPFHPSFCREFYFL